MADDPKSYIVYLRNWCIGAFVFWLILISGSVLFFINNEWQAAMDIAKELGISIIQKDVAYRIWNTRHGGVYVPVTDETRPNQYLQDIPTRDIDLGQGKQLTLMNPAYMTRQVHELGRELYGVRGHITSLNVIRPENEPDPWERDALQQFEEGAQEVAEFVTMSSQPFMRVMTPLLTQEACLKCHAEQGYKVGNIRGGISVSVPMQEMLTTTRKQIFKNSLYHLLIFLVGLAGLRIFYLQTTRHLQARAVVEEDLKQQKSLLTGIVDNIASGIAIYEWSGEENNFIIKSINPPGINILKLQLADVVGKKVTEAFPGVVEMGLFEVFLRVRQTGEPEYYPVTFYEDERISLWVENHVYRLDSGEIVAVYTDVSERKQTEDQLRAKTEEWEKTFDAIPDIITLQDSDRNILKANRAALNFFAQQPENVIGLPCYTIFRGASEPCDGCPATFSIGDEQNHFAVIEHPAIGKIFQVSSSPVLGRDGEVLYTVCVAKDITTTKRLEQELLQAQKMEAIGTLAGGIAHDFNNILSAIIGYSELVKAEVEEGSRAGQDIDLVLKAGDRATALVKQILTFSRKRDQQKKPLRIDVIVKEALKMMRSSLPTTIDIKTEIDPDCGLVLADPTCIHQVIANLCTNSFHAIGNSQGKLEVSLQQVNLTHAQLRDKPGAAAGVFVVLSVKDNGRGMDEKTVKRIFEPYFTTKEQEVGTGLGLAVTHAIVEDCKGFIEVESRLGEGTLFRVYLPAVEEEPFEQKIEEEGAELPRGNERILLLDDEPSITRIGQAILTNLGYTVTAATKSPDGLAFFRSAPDAVDLVVTDQTMPELTGAELSRIMLDIKPDLPIILCTGFTAAITEEEALAIGIKRFLLKPINKRKLAETVRQVLDEQKTI